MRVMFGGAGEGVEAAEPADVRLEAAGGAAGGAGAAT